MSDRDVRGVRRGRCKKCSGCACFTKSSESIRCIKCGHTPAEHEKVPEKSVDTATALQSVASSDQHAPTSSFGRIDSSDSS